MPKPNDINIAFEFKTIDSWLDGVPGGDGTKVYVIAEITILNVRTWRLFEFYECDL